MIFTESTKYLNKIQTILENRGEGDLSNKLDAIFKDACNELKRMGSRKIGGKPLREILMVATLKERAELIEMFGPLFVFNRQITKDAKGNSVPTCKVKMIKSFPAIIAIELIKMTEAWSILGDYSENNKILFVIEIEDDNPADFKFAYKRFIGYFSLLPDLINWVDFKLKLSDKQNAILRNEEIAEIAEAETEEEEIVRNDLIYYENTYPLFSVLVNKDDVIKTAEDYPQGHIPKDFLFMVKEQNGFAYSFLYNELYNGKDFKEVKKYLNKIKPQNNIIATSKQQIEKVKDTPVLSFSFIIEKEGRMEMVFYNYMLLKNVVVNLIVQTVVDENDIDEIKQLYIKYPLLLSVKKIIENIDYSNIEKSVLPKKERNEHMQYPKELNNIKHKTYTCDKYGFSITLPETYIVKNTAEAIKEGHHKDTIFTVKATDNFFFRIFYEGTCSKKPFETAEKMIETLKNAPSTIKSSKAVKNIINGLEVISFSYCTRNSKYEKIMLTSLNFIKIKKHIINLICIYSCEDESQMNILLKNPVSPRLIKYIKCITVNASPDEERKYVEAQKDDPLVAANTAILRYLVYKEKMDIDKGNDFINRLMAHKELYEEFKNSIKNGSFSVSIENQVKVEGYTALDLLCLGSLTPSGVYNYLMMLKENPEITLEEIKNLEHIKK